MAASPRTKILKVKSGSPMNVSSDGGRVLFHKATGPTSARQRLLQVRAVCFGKCCTKGGTFAVGWLFILHVCCVSILVLIFFRTNLLSIRSVGIFSRLYTLRKCKRWLFVSPIFSIYCHILRLLHFAVTFTIGE